jgi:glycosyltransferase involved in cell wall biosynthesis
MAEACPDLQFDVVGPRESGDYSARMEERGKTISNVKMHGAVSRDQMPNFYKQAACLCCTSDFEGFPNTFLEAWSHGLPVVSLFDPDDLIAERRLGAVADDTKGLAVALRELLASPDRWREASLNARRYYTENHTMETVMPKFEKAFLDTWKDSMPARTRET